MRRPLAALGLPLIAVALTLGLAACAEVPSSGPNTVEVTPDTVVLDVRSPEEFEARHLEGAELLDFNSGELAEAIPTLDPEAEYLVYCRSGNRSGQAIALMEQAGFENLTNLGSLEQAAASTGLAVIR